MSVCLMIIYIRFAAECAQPEAKTKDSFANNGLGPNVFCCTFQSSCTDLHIRSLDPPKVPFMVRSRVGESRQSSMVEGLQNPMPQSPKP